MTKPAPALSPRTSTRQLNKTRFGPVGLRRQFGGGDQAELYWCSGGVRRRGDAGRFTALQEALVARLQHLVVAVEVGEFRLDARRFARLAVCRSSIDGLGFLDLALGAGDAGFCFREAQ